MKKSQRPIERKFWSYLKYLPAFLRAPYLRTKFEIPNELPADIVLKQAETEDEINAALQLVYESYLELNYIDPNQARKRLTKFHLLPTTVILIIKLKEEVIGTISIIMDSSMKLPSDATWDLGRFRKNGAQIAEISSLCIKKSEYRRGKLLLPLCKLMYLYCKNYLKLDGIIVSATLEVEAFYTDLLLFEKVVMRTGQRNKLVKNNPSTCCFLPLHGQTAETMYKQVYHKKPQAYNLYKFFVETITPNIQLPEPKACLQSYTYKQISAISKIVSRWPEALSTLTSQDLQIISNLDLVKEFEYVAQPKSQARIERLETRQKIKCFLTETKQIIDVTLLNVSAGGFKICLHDDSRLMAPLASVVIYFNDGSQTFTFTGEIKWSSKSVLGCQVKSNIPAWENYIKNILNEFESVAA